MKKKILQLISTFLVLVLLANMLPLQIFAENLQTEAAEITPEAVTEEVTPETIPPEKATVVAEITENRTEYSKEFLLSNGLYMASVYADPVHYETETGWEEIDNTLKANRDGSYSNTAGVWNVTLPKTLGKENTVTIQKDGYTLSFHLSGEVTSGLSRAQTTAEVAGLVAEKAASKDLVQASRDRLSSRITYAGILPDTDILYDLDSNRVKESILLKEYDPSLQGYTYTLQTGELLPVLGEDGVISLYGEGKEPVMVMPAPYLIDSNGAYSFDVAVALTGEKGSYTLTYTLPTSWLAAKDRAWPVVLDPEVQANLEASNIRDRTVTEKKTYEQTWGMNSCGYDPETGIMRFYLKYNTLPQIYSSDVVVGATIRMYKAYASSTVTTVFVHKPNATWDSSSITWSNAPAFGSAEDYAVVDAVSWYSWEVTDIVRDWYANKNTGMVFKASNVIETGGTANFKQFLSADFGTAASRPVLTVYYRNNNGLESYWDYTASSAGRAGTGYVNNYTGNMVWVREDMGFGGNRMPVTISHIYNLNDSANNDFGLGYGWRTNYNQRIDTKTLSGVTYYVWEDSDGTDHYFRLQDGKYQDEDGLELTLTLNTGGYAYCLTDKTGNCSYFDSQGRLVKLTNNQATKSHITITYYSAHPNRIQTITDGVGRVYTFEYGFASDYYVLKEIHFTADQVKHGSITFGYDNNGHLTSATDRDGETSRYTYSGNLLTSAKDIGGYELTYTYIRGNGDTWQPYRVYKVTEKDGSALGGELTFTYAHNQTTVTDYNGKKQVYQFNDFGNTMSVRDDEGRGQFASYARNNRTDTAGKGNQLKVASQLQTTVGNLLPHSSFESGNYWASNATSTLTVARNNTEAYQGSYSLKLVSTATSTVAALSPSFSVAPGETVTFSAYIKSTDAGGCLGIYANNTVTTGGHFNAGMDWTRLQVSYTNNTQTAHNACCGVFTSTTNAIYVDCVQFEKTTTASRYNLVENSTFNYGTTPPTGWTGSALNANNDKVITLGTTETAAPQLENHAFQITGDTTQAKRIYQDVKCSGLAGDSYVLAGWAKGNSVPLNSNATASQKRFFGMKAVFYNTDGTTTTRDVSFNPDCPNSWQYAASAVIAEEDYSSIRIYVCYDYNANTAYFDGIQLFREEFGNSYTYDDKGNVISVKDLQGKNTTYEYDTNNDLTKVIENTQAKMTYTYDGCHNVKTATTGENVVYTFTYDTWGNNLSVSVGSGSSNICATATYSANGNMLASTTDALGKVTTYQYNENTGVLEMVKYPGTADGSETYYAYDEMYRTSLAACYLDIFNPNFANYTYTDDLLTQLHTPGATYNFTYGAFDLRSGVSVGNRTLATYHYTEETVDDRRYDLDRLDYGNGDSVQYEYDDEQRLIKQTYEDGTYVSYTYNNDGDIRKVYDSQSGITTTYTYDLTGRTVKISQSGTNHSHSVSYGYDTKNNLTQQTEIVNGTTTTTQYTYDKDNRLTAENNGTTKRVFSYDNYGRMAHRALWHNGSAFQYDKYTFYSSATGGLSTQVKTVNTAYGGYNYTYTYSYDDNGNITGISDGTNTTSYVYDSLNQLLRENNQAGGYTHTWTYNSAGNIVSRTEYPYTTGDLTGVTPTDTITYTYGDTNWGDLLTAYDEQALTYDDIGNLTSDGEWTYTWKHGRQLATATGPATTWTYTYNDAGLRTKKVASTGVYMRYVYDGSRLSEFNFYGNILKFTYDANGTPLTVSYNGALYYYVTNLQGDVVAILNTDKQPVVQYTYDAWGKLLSRTGSMASTLGQYNPLRYRGYVYDLETGLYYLQSRYYDPEWGRFINADGLVSTGQGLTGNNMFAYCGNNPVVYTDPAGTARTYSVQMTDTGYNVQARAYASKIVYDGQPYHTKNFTKPARLISQSLSQDGYSYVASYSRSHSQLDSNHISVSADVFLAEVGFGWDFKKGGFIGGGIYLFKVAFAVPISDEVSLELAFALGIGLELLGKTKNPKPELTHPGLSLSLVWDENVDYEYYE